MSKKQWLIIKLILLIAMFLTLVGISIKVIKGSISRNTVFDTNMINGVSTEEGERKAFMNVEKIVIDSISLPVNIYESDVSEVTIQDNSTVYGLGVGKPNRVSCQGGVLTFKQAKRISILSFVKGNVVIEVPRGSVLEYDIENISGNIAHDALSKGKLRVGTISGSIKVYQGGESVVAESISGSLRISAPFKGVSAESVSGSVNLLANQDSKEISASSISGSITIQLEKVSGYEMDYSTVSSSVKDTYSNINYSKSGEAIHGNGSLEIEADSVSGSIKLADWK